MAARGLDGAPLRAFQLAALVPKQTACSSGHRERRLVVEEPVPLERSAAEHATPAIVNRGAEQGDRDLGVAEASDALPGHSVPVEREHAIAVDHAAASTSSRAHLHAAVAAEIENFG